MEGGGGGVLSLQERPEEGVLFTAEKPERTVLVARALKNPVFILAAGLFPLSVMNNAAVFSRSARAELAER